MNTRQTHVKGYSNAQVKEPAPAPIAHPDSPEAFEPVPAPKKAKKAAPSKKKARR